MRKRVDSPRELIIQIVMIEIMERHRATPSIVTVFEFCFETKTIKLARIILRDSIRDLESTIQSYQLCT